MVRKEGKRVQIGKEQGGREVIFFFRQKTAYKIGT